METLPAHVQVPSLLQSLEKELSVSIRYIEGKDLAVTAVRGPGTSYREGYLATWFAFQRLEELVGTIAHIQGLPREKWKTEFSTIERLA